MAAIDDIMAIFFMALLFRFAPIFQSQEYESFLPIFVSTVSMFLLKFMVFIMGCFLFSYIMETRGMAFMRRLETLSDPILMTVSTGFIIAAMAAILGFTLALGAFFAGIAFSRDPKAQITNESFKPMEDFFAPFFFIGIGL